MIPTPVKIVPHRASSTRLFLLLLCGLTLPSIPAPAQQPAPSPQRAYTEAVQLYNQQLYGNALTAFEAYRAAYPDHIQTGQALYLGAKAALVQDHDAEAVRLFSTLQRTHPSHPALQRPN